MSALWREKVIRAIALMFETLFVAVTNIADRTQKMFVTVTIKLFMHKNAYPLLNSVVYTRKSIFETHQGLIRSRLNQTSEILSNLHGIIFI